MQRLEEGLQYFSRSFNFYIYWYLNDILFISSSLSLRSPSLRPSPNGHVVAARITSENPDEVSRR